MGFAAEVRVSGCTASLGKRMSVPSQSIPLTRAERSALSDQMMLEAAYDLVLEHGLEKTTLALIGQHSGYSRGLATHRFGSKAGLFEALCRSLGSKWQEYLKAEVGEKTGLGAMLASVDALHRWAEERPGDAKVFQILLNDTTCPGSSMPAIASQAHARHHASVTEWIREGQRNGEVREHIDVDAAAAYYVAYVSGIVYLWLINPEVFDFARTNAEMKRQVLASLSADPAHRILA